MSGNLSEAVHYVARGEGETTVLMLHGIGGGHQAFAAQLEAFARAGYHAVAWDMPGYGRSASIDPYDMAGLAKAAGGLVDALGAHRLVLLGHSMGAMVAQELVSQYPQLTQGLVLCATSAAFGRADGPWQRDFVAARLAPLDAGKSMAQLAQQLVSEMVAPEKDQRAMDDAIRIMAQVPDQTYRSALQAIVGFDRRTALANIAVPTLLIAGDSDRAAPVKVMQGMAQRIAKAQMVTLKQCGHLVNIEQPDAFNQAVLTFLAQHFPV